MIKDLLMEGFALKNNGHYKHAIEVFYKAMEQDNTSSELLLEIADSYYRLHNEEKALEYIEQILKREPAHINSLKLLKKIFKDKNALTEAEQTAKNIYCITKSSSDLAEIFRLLNAQGKYEEISEYNIPNPDAEVLLEIARGNYCRKDFENSERILNDILSANPDNQNALLLQGQLMKALNRKNECLAIADKLILDKTNPECLDFAAYAEYLSGNYKKAIEYLRQAIKLSRSNDNLYFDLANIYFKLGDSAAAGKNYNLAISINPENNNYHFALANLYYSEKHYKKALEELTQDFFEARLLKSVILYDTGYLALAQKELHELQAEQPENEIINNYLSKIKEELKIS